MVQKGPLIKIGMLISISGFDGVGKTTQVKLLSQYLKNTGKTFHTTESMFGYFLLRPLIKVLRLATGSPSGGPVKRNKKILLKLWFIPAFIDIWLGYIFKIRPLLLKYDFIIADRFYTDIWANLLYYRYLPNWAFKVFVKLLPRSDIAIMLLANPKKVLGREKEFASAYYIEQAVVYEHLASQINFYIIDANKHPKSVLLKIKKLLILYRQLPLK